jgi:hypothetical protein
MREPYCPLSSAVCNATIHGVVYEGTLLSTLLCSLQRYYTWGGAWGNLTAHSPLQSATLLYMGWCMREPYCPLSFAVCNATMPTLPLFEMAESACSPFCYSVTFTLYLVYNVYIGFLSQMRDWTVAVAQYSTFACSSTVYLKIWQYT